MTPIAGPPDAVLAAFGLEGPAVVLPGGQGTSWSAGDAVLKPDGDPRFQEWLSTEVNGVRQRGFRLPDVRRSATGSFIVDGWAAQSFLTGAACSGPDADWPAVVRAGRALHAATAGLSRPPFLDARTDPWGVADRMAWGEVPVVVAPEHAKVVARLSSLPRPSGTAQLVHGDLTSNVLLDRDAAPAVIDFSPYWRPSAYAEGVVVADALLWHGAGADFLDRVSVSREAVASALLFRFLTDRLRQPPPAGQPTAEQWGGVLDDLGL